MEVEAPARPVIAVTTLGHVPVWGAPFSRERPLLLIIRGAFVTRDMFVKLVGQVGPCDVALTHLPGLHSPFLSENSVEVFAAAFDEVLAKLGHRDVVIVGQSIGGPVAMAMRSPAIRRLMLLDSPLSTASLWMLPDIFRGWIRSAPALAPWIWDVFGISETTVENRDYRPLLAGLRVPAEVLAAGDPLGDPRPLVRTPSLISEDDMAAYEATPGMSVAVVADCGHDILADARLILLARMLALVNTVIDPADRSDAHFAHSEGLRLARLGLADEAESLLLTAFAINPSLPGIQAQLGLLYRQAGRLAEAESAFRRALHLFPDSAIERALAEVVLARSG